MANKQPDIKLPVWMNKGEPLTLAHAAKIWWDRVYDWLTFPLAQIDVDTCDEQLLDLLAYQRDIERFPKEPLSLYRLRVKHAFINSQDAGSVAGFVQIFKRLEIGKIQQLERQLQYDWDVIVLRINDEQLSRNNDLMMRLVRQYGRTCRRYFFDVLNDTTEYVHSGGFDCVSYFDHAKLIIRPSAIVPEKTTIWLLPWETKTISVQVLPEDAEDRTFTIKTNNNSATLTREGSTLRITGRDFGDTEITLTTNDGNKTATITARVVSGAKVDMYLTDKNSAIFYLDTNNGVKDENIEKIYVDWGDGVEGKNFKKLENSRGIITTADLETNKTYTVTVYNSETIHFPQASYNNNKNPIIKLYKIASPTRTSVYQLLYQQRNLTEIDSDAFVHLPNIIDGRSMLEYCTSLTALPRSLFTGETPVEDLRRAFWSSAINTLPKGFLQKATKLRDIDRMLGYCPITDIEDGMLGACNQTLQYIQATFTNCTLLTSDINKIFSAHSYPKMVSTHSAFYWSSVTGEGLRFIEKFGQVNHTGTFAGCRQLSDYYQIPSDWK
ncbi:Ig-like domain-containing protein [Providencia hangzhouensis]|uniref:Ig-like domain-containing protein n=1 Tax=Providencia hangzhouensis TaxID=3031799 RepID=UPI003F68C5D3